MSSTSDTNEKKSSIWGKSISNAATLLGTLSTGLGVFITMTTLSINARINNLQATNLELDNRLKNIDSVLKENEGKSSQFENSVRLEAEFRVFNANAFATSYKEKGMKIVWLDEKSQNDIENWLEKWISGNNLMTGTPQNGLFARQVVCLRIINAGKTPARKIKLVTKKASFDNGNGKFGEPYYEIDTRKSIWKTHTISIDYLAESSQKEVLKTQILIPLAHVSGSSRYFGNVFIPLDLTWDDVVQGKPGKMSIDIKSNGSLRSDLRSSMLYRVSNF
ncbi:hypothetical protein [Phormidesmis sp. 146-33]